MVHDELNASDIECAHCGERFYYELTRCPNCGVNVYFPEADEDTRQEVQSGSSAWTITKEGNWLLEAVLGWLASAGGFTLFYLIIQRTFSLEAGSDPETYSIHAVTILGSATAGFVSARSAKHHPAFYGLLAGLYGISISILLFAYTRDLATFTLITPTTLIAWTLAVTAGYLGGRLAIYRTGQVALQQLFERQSSEADLYQNLLSKARFDKSLVNRLIAFESKHAPNASRTYLIERAIERWERDNR